MTWERFDILRNENLPPCAGCYAVYFDSALVYIGQSNNIRNRFTEHKIRYGYGKNILTPWGALPETTSIFIKIKRSKRRGDWAMWEIRLIHRLQPLLNKRLKGRKSRG